jgi:hypothetical protein
MPSLIEFLAENDRILAEQCRAHKRETGRWKRKLGLKEKRTAAKLEAERRYRARNRGRCNAWKAKRRAMKLKATPSWVNLKEIEEIYKQAKSLGLTVDHIHPLQGENFCGLHVPWNLQLLTKAENSAKSNKLTA